MPTFRVTDHHEVFFSLPAREREEIQETLERIEQIAMHPRGVVAGAQAAARPGRGYSAKSLLRKYYAYLAANGDWRALIDRATVRQRTPALADEFIEFWRSLCEKNQRKCKPAYRELIRRYLAGEAIPGLCPADGPRQDLPAGLSYANLMRYAPSRFELVARRQGRGAAAAFRPLTYTTRVGLKVGQYYIFDDLEHDVKVNVLGINRSAMRPLELACLDLFSGCKIAWGVKPTLENDDGTKQKLKEREMRFLLAHVLVNIGYRLDGTVLMVEHGTAAIRESIERLLFDLSNGAIRVHRGGIEGAAAFAGAYCGRPKGNFRIKAALESLHNLVHNELAALPGQTGKSRDSAPEELFGRERHNDRLLAALATLPPEAADQLRLPFLPFSMFVQILDRVYRLINNRIDHELEGFEEAGLIEQEYRLAPNTPWLPMRNLLLASPEERKAIETVIKKPGYVRSRKLSPAEVWNRGCEDLARLPPYAAPSLIGEDLAVERRLGHNHLFEFEDRELGPGVHRFEGRVTTPDGRVEYLKPGDTYLCFVNPFEAERRLYVCGPKLNFIGSAEPWNKVCRSDLQALHRAMGRAAAYETELLVPLARRGAEITRKRLEDARHNAQVMRAYAADQPRPSSGGAVEMDAEVLRAALACDASLAEASPEEIADVLKD
ncbi:MAG: hypothetical protein ONB24_15280 [candidate division KSB1 bacterium]|nr:hypothetical protein [candidate division KSB1 bacterium]